MLNLRQVKHLSARLGYSTSELVEIADNVSSFVEELILIDPKQPDKPRDVINVTGMLRSIQQRIYRRLLLVSFIPSEQSHGGIPHRHIKTNAILHADSTFAFTTDISSFYPSIHHSRVYRFFVESQGCSPDVSRLLTRLCTYSNHLALGLTTSPIIADQIMRPIDSRISTACRRAGLIYSRFVDDIAISGNYSLDPRTSGIPSLAVKILNESGFAIQSRKHKFGRIQDGFTITSLRIRRGKVDVDRQYIQDIDEQLEDAKLIARGERPVGLYYTYLQLRGRVEFAAWINRFRRRSLMRRLRSIDWSSVSKNAISMGLQSSKKQLRPRRIP